MKKYRLLVILLVMALSFSAVYSYSVEKDVYNIIVNALSAGGGDAGTHVPNGATKDRTGYLCYVVTEDGKEVSGTHPVFIKSKNYERLSGAKDIMKPRNGLYSNVDIKRVSDDLTLPRPWNVDSKTNTVVNMGEEVKSKFSLSDGGKFLNDFKKAVGLEDSDEVTKKINDGEYLCVVEIVMNFQFSKSVPVSIASKYESEARKKAKAIAELIIGNKTPGLYESDDPLPSNYNVFVSKCSNWDPQYFSVFSKVQKNHGTYAQLTQRITEIIYETAKESAQADVGGKEYELQGTPVEGTIPNLVEYRNSHGYGHTIDLYINNHACWVLFLDKSMGDLGGFTAYDGQTGIKLSDDKVLKYGVAMLCFSFLDASTPEPVTPSEIPEMPWAKDPHGVLLVDNEGIRVHTPVISPVSVTNPEKSTQLITPESYEVVRYQLLLDGTYNFHWDAAPHLL